MGDLNIDTQKNGADTSHYLSDLYYAFSLADLISSSTCFKSLSGTSIDLFLTNRTKSFHNTAIAETGRSDHHKLITSFFGIRKNIFACRFSVYNTTNLPRHEQVCLMRVRFERYLSHHGRSISRNIASLKVHFQV